MKDALTKADDLIEPLEPGKKAPPAICRRVGSAQSFLRDLLEGRAEADAKSLDLGRQLIRFAVGETSQGVADANRNADAMKLAELNRAAESVSRALGAVLDEKAAV